MVIWLVSLSYFLFFWWTVKRFVGCVYDHPPKWYKRLYWIPIWGRSGLFPRACLYPFRILLRIMEIMVGYMLAIPLFMMFQIVDLIEWKERKADKKRWAKQAEKDRQHREWAKNTNEVRALGRRKYFELNKPKLYFNTVSGITAVLRPSDWEAAKKETEKARTNELWEHNVLRPQPATYTFVTKTGSELIQTNDSRARRYKVAGWLADLHEICQQTECSLLRDETIFVPWVNETILTFAEQGQAFHDCHGKASIAELINRQAPAKLLPVA